MEDRLERRVVTVLFGDVVGFTTLSERLDPEDVATVQGAYFASVRELIELYGGTLEKFIGDAVMAVFGVPVAHDDDAERAVRAAVALTHAVESLGARLGLDEGLRVRVGVNTGEVLYDREASDTALVTGDTVNVAARLQAAAPPGGVLVGPETALAAVDAIELAEVEALELKGKTEAVRAQRALAVREERSREHAMGALRAPLVGRDDALGRLREAQRLLVLVAPPGSGKSRLLLELDAELDGAARAWVRPDALGAFEPVAQLVLVRLGPERESGLRERLVAAGLNADRAGVVAEELGALLASRPSMAGDRDAMFAAWLDGLDALAPGGDVWLVEDVHWAAHDLLAFLELAAARNGRLVVASARPALLEREPEWCERADVVDLPPLEPVSARTLVRALVGDALPAELVEEIATVSDGNPLFIEELLRTWISVGVLVHDGDWRLARDAADVTLPLNVQAIYTAQLDDLRSSARLVVRRASVAGRRFAAAALEALDVDAPDEGLSDLVRRALLRGPEPDHLFGDGFLFRHALLRDAGYASLARAERALLHLRLADWLPEAAGDRWPEVAEVTARHLAAVLEHAPALATEIDGRSREDVAARAADWYERAARVALERAAHSSARALVRSSLDLTAPGSPEERARRLELLADATATSGDLDEAKEAYELAAELYRAAGDDSGAARATVGQGLALCQQIRFEAAIALAEAELARTQAPPLDRAGLVLLLARGRIYMGHADESTSDALADVQRLAQEAGDRGLELKTLQLQASFESEDGESQLETWRDVERLAVELGSWAAATSAARTFGFELSFERRAEALAHFQRAEDLARAHGLTEDLAWTELARAELFFTSSDWDSAVDAGRRALEIAEPNAYHRAAVRTWFVLVPIAHARGDAELLGHARRWFDVRIGEFPSSQYGLLMHTACSFALGTPAPAQLSELLAAFDLEFGGGSWLAAVEAVVRRMIEEGDLENAAVALGKTAAPEEAGDDPLRHVVVGLGRARLELAREDAAAASTHARSVLQKATELDLSWWHAKALRVLGAAGSATTEELAEAKALEARLRLDGPAV